MPLLPFGRLSYNDIMKTVGIIAEYNPFHNGHAYQLKEAKKATGADFAVVVMSGDFVQRGEPAMFDKRLRAGWALQNGADMVILLPVPFSLACAEVFALGGVTLLHESGIADCIAFGSESGDIRLLSKAADALDSEPQELRHLIKVNASKGLSYPSARARAFEQCFSPELAALFSSPNNILGIEYLRALKRLGSAMQSVAIARTGAAHDSRDADGIFASASSIRELIAGGSAKAAEQYLPAGIYEDISKALGDSAPITLGSLSREAVYALRMLSREQLKKLPDVSEGLENLLYSACRAHGDIFSVLSAVKSRRYTMARLKRICMCALLGIYGSPALRLDELYIRVLGVRREALPLLSAMHERSSLPIVTRFGDRAKLNEKQLSLLEFDLRCAEIAALGRPKSVSAKPEFSYPLLIV